MVLDSLANPADLPSAWVSHPDAGTALSVASAAIRAAAGCSISELTGTVTVVGDDERLLRLPGPITGVTAVSVDGCAVTDYKVFPEGLWRSCGWSVWGPVVVVVSYTGGLAEVPADIVDLCVQLAVAWLRHQEAGGGSMAGITQAALDDAKEAYTSEAAGQVSPVFIPALTRKWLATRFGGGATVVSST